MKIVLFIAVLIHCSIICRSQDTLQKWKNFSYQGYIKNLESLGFIKNNSKPFSNNLIHNRLNLKWDPFIFFHFVGEFRNRIFWGEQLNASSILKTKQYYLDLEKTWTSNSNFIAHTNIERLYADYNNNRLKIRLGRQRINWGITTIWNPNDIYNTFNFLDIDYEERPGSDAINGSYTISDFSNISFVHSSSKHQGNITSLRYFFNKNNYDFQFIAGRYHQQATVGFGWAGNIKESGFKGEVQYYFRRLHKKSMLNSSIELDQTFKNGWYVKGGMLYNHRGITRSLQTLTELDLEISPENMMPARWNIFWGMQKEINPLSSYACNLIYAPGMDLIILLPTYQYNIATNWDIDMIGQSFFLSVRKKIQAIQWVGMVRLRWSF